jgi:hypothetical protein
MAQDKLIIKIKNDMSFEDRVFQKQRKEQELKRGLQGGEVIIQDSKETRSSGKLGETSILADELKVRETLWNRKVELGDGFGGNLNGTLDKIVAGSGVSWKEIAGRMNSDDSGSFRRIVGGIVKEYLDLTRKINDRDKFSKLKSYEEEFRKYVQTGDLIFSKDAKNEKYKEAA